MKNNGKSSDEQRCEGGRFPHIHVPLSELRHAVVSAKLLQRVWRCADCWDLAVNPKVRPIDL